MIRELLPHSSREAQSCKQKSLREKCVKALAWWLQCLMIPMGCYSLSLMSTGLIWQTTVKERNECSSFVLKKVQWGRKCLIWDILCWNQQAVNLGSFFFVTGSKLIYFAMSMMSSPQIWKLCKFWFLAFFPQLPNLLYIFISTIIMSSWFRFFGVVGMGCNIFERLATSPFEKRRDDGLVTNHIAKHIPSVFAD